VSLPLILKLHQNASTLWLWEETIRLSKIIFFFHSVFGQ
jgi:hypothetical protein